MIASGGARISRVQKDKNYINLTVPLIHTKILTGSANETNGPGSFSKRAVNLVSDMDRSDAELFSTVCGFLVIIDGDPHILVTDIRDDIYRKNGLHLKHLQHLEAIGLIRLGETGEFYGESRDILIEHHGRTHIIRRKKGKTMPLGWVSLTSVGKQLTTIANPKPVPGFFEHCRVPLSAWVT